MRTNFVLPTASYNIILSKTDLKQLLITGYISYDPTRQCENNNRGNSHKGPSHNLAYIIDTYETNPKYTYGPIQFVGVALQDYKKPLHKRIINACKHLFKKEWIKIKREVKDNE